MTFSNSPSSGVALQGGGGSGGAGASAPLTGTGATVTTSQPLIDVSQTWNNAAVTFTSLKLNITDTASNAASLLMDLGTGGGSFVSKFSVQKNGYTKAVFATINSGASELNLNYYQPGFGVSSTGQFTFSSTASASGPDTFITRRGAANLRLGAADTGSNTATVTITIATPGVVTWSSHGLSTGTPVFFTTTGALPTGITASTTYYVIFVTDSTFQIATSLANALAGTAVTTSGTQSGVHTGARNAITQRLSVQSVTGVTDRPGADTLITGSQGTGNAAGGSLIFQVAPAGLTGSAQNALATALTITSARNFQFTGEAASTLTFAGEGIYALNTAGTNRLAMVSQYGIRAAANVPIGFSDSTTSVGTQDVFLYRDDANKLALRNGAAAQEFRVYETESSSLANHSRLSMGYDAANTRFFIAQQRAGTGAARELYFQGGAGSGFIYSRLGANIIAFGQDGVGVFWNLTSAGHLLAQTDNLYDIGASGATRPRRMFAAGYITAPEVLTGNIKTAGGSGGLEFNSTTLATLTQTTFAIGGTTSSFPAIKRSTTFLQARLADDSAFAGFASANMQAATAYIVATLPGTPGTGMIARVTDASSPTIGTTVAGSGAAYALVNYNGANWTVIGV